MLTIHTQIQEGLHFKSCTMTCRKGREVERFQHLSQRPIFELIHISWPVASQAPFLTAFIIL